MELREEVKKQQRKDSRQSKRMRHNEMERQRRYILKKKCNALADSLPNLDQGSCKLSRQSILTRATEFIRQTKERKEIFRKENLLLAEQNKRLGEEISTLIEQKNARKAAIEKEKEAISAFDFERRNEQNFLSETSVESEMEESVLDHIKYSSEFDALSDEFGLRTFIPLWKTFGHMS